LVEWGDLRTTNQSEHPEVDFAEPSKTTSSFPIFSRNNEASNIDALPRF